MNNASDAINALLKGNLQKAIELNLELIKENPKDTEALNRLAFAYNATGDGKSAKEIYKKVLKIDPNNQIAIKNSKKVSDTTSSKKDSSIEIPNNLFIEEVGKTKIISLVNTTQPKILKQLQVGQPLNLVIKRSKIFALTASNIFIGKLPDNLSIRLLKFIKGGNKYESFIKSVDNSNVEIFIKETKRVTKFKDQPSFLNHDQLKNKLDIPNNLKKSKT